MTLTTTLQSKEDNTKDLAHALLLQAEGDFFTEAEHFLAPQGLKSVIRELPAIEDAGAATRNALCHYGTSGFFASPYLAGEPWKLSSLEFSSYNEFEMEDTITWAWLIAGIVLVVTEIFLPGLVVSFLGLAAIIVACLRWLGFLSGWMESLGTWFVTSMILLVGVRTLALRWFPGESSYQATDEDLEAIGTVVDVVDTIDSSDVGGGRIRYMGTSWPATTKGRFSISAGQKARLLYRENLIWVVEPYLELDSDSSKEIE